MLKKKERNTHNVSSISIKKDAPHLSNLMIKRQYKSQDRRADKPRVLLEQSKEKITNRLDKIQDPRPDKPKVSLKYKKVKIIKVRRQYEINRSLW